MAAGGGDTFGQAGGKGQQRRWRLQGLCLGRARRRLLSVCALVCHYSASLRQFFTFCPLVRGRPKAPAVHAFLQTFIIFPDHTFGAFISLFARALFTARALAYLRGGLGVVYKHNNPRVCCVANPSAWRQARPQTPAAYTSGRETRTAVSSPSSLAHLECH